jgi:cell shape-determining protein MreC
MATITTLQPHGTYVPWTTTPLVSSTQELAKKVEALEAEDAELKAHASRLATLEAQMEALEKSVSSQKNCSDTIRPVALNQ